MNRTRGAVANPERLSALASLAAHPYDSLDEALEAIVHLVADLFSIGLVLVQRLEDDSFVITHVLDRIGLGLAPPITVPRKATFCDAVVASVTPLIVPDADLEERYRALPGKVLVGTRTYIGVPILLSEGRVYGTLCAHDRHVLDLGQAEVEALLILARFVASHIERDAALAQEAANAHALRERNTELAEAIRQLDALGQIVESVSSHLDVRALLQQVVSSAVELLGAHAGAISLIGDSLDAPRRWTATHNLPAEIARDDLPSNVGLMGQVIEARGPVIVERYHEVDRPLQNQAFYDLAPWIAVPLWWHGEIIGTFGIGARDHERVFGDRDVALLTQLAKHAAVAVENARLYADSRMLGAAEERNRLAREIHDTLAQSLLALIFQLRAASGMLERDPVRAADELADAEHATRIALEEARRSVWNLSPSALESGTLLEAIDGELARVRRAGVKTNLHVSGTPGVLDPAAQLTALRVAQEAIANARRHSGATKIDVVLDYRRSVALLSIADDGSGFDPDLLAAQPAAEGGFGLPGMRARVTQVGGELTIESRAGQGTCIRAILPYSGSVQSPSEKIAVPSQPHTERPAEPGHRIRVVVVDDHPAVRAGLASLLQNEPDIEVIGQASDGEEAVAVLERLRPDVLLVDLQMPRLGGVEVIELIRTRKSSTKAIVVTTFPHDDLILDALRAGARGYLLKDSEAEVLATAVRTVHAGGTLVAPAVASRLAAGIGQRERLTSREREVLAQLAKGLSDKEIALAIGTSAKTVNFHVANLLAKLPAQNRADAVRLAYERGLLSL